MDVSPMSASAPEDDWERSGFVRGSSGFAYGVGQTWLPLGGYVINSPAPKDRTFEFWRGAGQITAGIVEVVAGAGLVGAGAGGAAGGVVASAATGGASLFATWLGASAVATGWVLVTEGGLGMSPASARW